MIFGNNEFSGLSITLLVMGRMCSFDLGTGLGISWTKSETMPVVLEKPSLGGFVPIEGSSIGNSWTRHEVKPVILLRPGLSGFEPRDGFGIGNTWSKGEAIPVLLVEPSITGFVPLHELADSSQPPGGLPDLLCQRDC